MSNEDKKEYWVEVSFTGKIKMMVDAENKEETKEKVFNTIQLDIESNDKDIQIEEVEWDLIDKAETGNIRESYVDDMYIELEE